MHFTPLSSRFRWIFRIALFFSAIETGAVCAGDRERSFLEALRQNGYFDTAADYLEYSRTSPLTPPAFAPWLDYETAVTQIENAKRILNPVDRQSLLDKAKERLEKFLVDHPKPPYSLAAKSQLADIYAERGKMRLEQARTQKKPDRKKALLEDARALQEQALKYLKDLDEYYTTEWKKTSATVGASPDAEEDKRLQTDFIMTRLMIAQMQYELALTYEAKSDERKKKLTESIRLFDDLYQKNAGRIAGLYARLWQGRSLLELGSIDESLKIFNDLLILGDDGAAARILKLRAAALKLEALLKAKKYKEAVEFFGNGEKIFHGDEENTEEGIAVKYWAAEAAVQMAQRAKNASKEGEKSQKEKELEKTARNLLNDVLGQPGDYQAKARTLLADPLFGGGMETPASNAADEDVYKESRDQARSAMERAGAADIVAEQATRLRREAIAAFRRALVYAPRDVPIAEICDLRTSLAYVYWLEGDPYAAVTLGEAVATHYTDATASPQAAKLVLASYAKLYNDAENAESKSYYSEKMNRWADFMTTTWPTTATSDEAWSILFRTTLLNRDVAAAETVMNRMAADSPRRCEAELLLGRALWADYLEAASKPVEERSSPQTLREGADRAARTLESGILDMKKTVAAAAGPTEEQASNVLLLARIESDIGDPEKARQWLSDPVVGPLMLIESKHPLAQRDSFRLDVYKVALRVFVMLQEWERARWLMDAIDSDGDTNALRVYVGLGKQLEDAFRQLKEEGRLAEAETVRKNFEQFLTQIAARPASQMTFSALTWVAETFVSLGASLTAQDGKLTPEAAAYLNKAAEAYRKVLELCQTDPRFALQSNAATGVNIRLARCLRRLGRYNEAIDSLRTALKTKPNLLELQAEAARIYQEEGEIASHAWKQAVVGGEPVETPKGKENLVWGWDKLAARLEGEKKFETDFFDAQYASAFCRLHFALTATEEERNRWLNQAAREIKRLYLLYPAIGESQNRDRFDALLKEIQVAQGLPAVGLSALNYGADSPDKKKSSKNN